MIIPDAALDANLGVFGTTGSGKSYATRGLVERVLDRARERSLPLPRVGIVDPKGDAWGIRLGADGVSAGEDFVIIGGQHADPGLVIDPEKPVPLAVPIAEMIAASDVRFVLDVSDLDIGKMRKFMAEFFRTLYHVNRRPLLLVVDEADELAPMTSADGAGLSMGAMMRIAKRGRQRGMRLWPITQRPASLHTDIRGQCHSLAFLKLTLPHDRKAVADWLAGQGEDEATSAVIRSLPTLEKGEGWVWCPAAGFRERIRFPAIRTFDSMATPEDGKAIDRAFTAPLPPIDVGAVAAKLAELAGDAAEVEGADVKGLQAEVRRLKEQLRAALATPVSVAPEEMTALRNAAERFEALYEDAQARITAIRGALDAPITDRLRKSVTVDLSRSYKISDLTSPRPTPVPRVAARPPAESAAGGDGLGLGERSILTACAQHPDGCDREQLSVLCGYKRSSRDKYVQTLTQRGFLQPGEMLTATPAGLAALGDFDPLPVGDELRAYWLEKLPAGESKILAACAKAYPQPVTREELARETGYQRSSRDKYVQLLAARKLVITSRDGVVASATLFGKTKRRAK